MVVSWAKEVVINLDWLKETQMYLKENASQFILDTAKKNRKSLLNKVADKEKYLYYLLGKFYKERHFKQCIIYTPDSYYIVDAYIPELGLIIEVDGPYHNDVDQIAWDRKRDKYMNTIHLNVLRFVNGEMDALSESKFLDLIDLFRRHAEKNQFYT